MGCAKPTAAKAIGALVSPHLTNEENFRFGQLLRRAWRGQCRDGGAARQGRQFLIKAEKAANARGVRELDLVSGRMTALVR